jgi:hypothetical protein
VSAAVLVASILIFGVLVGLWRNERARRDERASTVEVEVDDDGVRRTLGDGRHERVRWDEITEVEVITTKVGVHRHDGVLVVLVGDAERGCLLPSAAAREHGLFDALARLPGLDFRALADAMEQPPPSHTTVWHRPA